MVESGATLACSQESVDCGHDPARCMELALLLGQEELKALQNGDVELAETCFARRTACVELAMLHRDTHAAILFEGLTALQALQAQLSSEGRALRSQLAAKLNQSKAEGRRLQGYKKAVGHALP